MNAWCLRWSATQSTIGPCSAICPSTASESSTGRAAANERCVNRRWKPTVTPNPVSRYITTSRPRSKPSTAWPHKQDHRSDQAHDRQDHGGEVDATGERGHAVTAIRSRAACRVIGRLPQRAVRA